MTFLKKDKSSSVWLQKSSAVLLGVVMDGPVVLSSQLQEFRFSTVTTARTINLG
jgi:hypothetical protein